MDAAATEAWFRRAVPAGWFTEPVDVTVDREEILVMGRLADPEVDDADPATRDAAATARIAAHREATRDQRVGLATEAEHQFRRKVSWGARCGEVEALFTHLAVPAMTRLRIRERAVLDTLIDAGVARSRSEALAWCVRLVGRHQGDWIAQLRSAMSEVERVRAEGPR